MVVWTDGVSSLRQRGCSCFQCLPRRRYYSRQPPRGLSQDLKCPLSSLSFDVAHKGYRSVLHVLLGHSLWQLVWQATSSEQVCALFSSGSMPVVCSPIIEGAWLRACLAVGALRRGGDRLVRRRRRRKSTTQLAWYERSFILRGLTTTQSF